MNLKDLSMACVDAINLAHEYGGLKNSTPCVTLQMPPSKRESPTRRLVPRGKCPIGQVRARMGDYDVVSFDAVDLLAWCVANSNGTIKIEGVDL